MKLSGQVAVITGGASGLGEATARAFATAGVRVGVLDINGDKAESFANSLSGIGLRCDVTDEASAKGALDEIYARLGKPRILVNCAGVAPAARIVGRSGPHDLNDFRRAIDINLVGTFNVMRLFAHQVQQLGPLEEGERGVIINTASIAAFEGQIGQAAYAASKGAIVALTLPAAREFAAHGIRVNAIAPGTFETPMLAGMPEAVQQSLGASVPFPQRLGKAKEYAQLALHIVDNVFINGAVIRLDGAMRMGSK